MRYYECPKCGIPVYHEGKLCHLCLVESRCAECGKFLPRGHNSISHIEVFPVPTFVHSWAGIVEMWDIIENWGSWTQEEEEAYFCSIECKEAYLARGTK